MNKTFCSVWNPSLGAWVAAPETTKVRGRTSGSGSATLQTASPTRKVSRQRSVVLALAAACALFGALPQAHAACTPFSPGTTVVCTGVIAGINEATNNPTVNIAPGAIITAPSSSSSAVTLSGNNVQLENNGTIDPSVIGIPSALTSAVTIGNSNNSLVTVINNGTISGMTDAPTSALLGSLTGMALNIQNGGFGSTTILNKGTLSSMPLSGTSMSGDAPVVAVWGGSRVNMANHHAIFGRVAFQASAAGNVFTNVGTIYGSVSLGAGAGANRYNALTGSWVESGGGAAGDMAVLNQDLEFASTGTVDGGAGGNNTLALQNGTGSGAGGSGSIAGDTYRNFSNLIVDSGTWTVSGPLLTGSTSTTINDGVLTLIDTLALGAGQITANGGTLQSGSVGLVLGNDLALQSGSLTLAGAQPLTLSGQLSGTGNLVKTGTGVTTLSGNNGAFTGTTAVRGGTLAVNNTLGGDVTVEAGGKITGTGTVGQNATVRGGGILEGVQGQTLKFGTLNLSQGSQINVALGGVNATPLFDVTGHLSLASPTLNVSNQGGFGAGVYQLFKYHTSMSFSPSAPIIIGTTPTGISTSQLTVQMSTLGQVNLVSTAGLTVNQWDGANTTPNGQIDGGSGIWNATASNWTSADGLTNGRYTLPSLATFSGAAGTVTVDNSGGAVGVTGITIGTDGYRIQGDSIALQGSGGQTVMLVGNITPASSSMVGTIASSLTGASKLMKSDFGTLVLAGNNTYTGGTDVRLGTLSVSSDANLGAASGDLTIAGGTLASTSSFTSNRAVTLVSEGTFNVAVDTQLGLAGTIDGNGQLIKKGAGTLALTGNNHYTNTTWVQAGTLIGDSASIRGNLLNYGSVIFDQSLDGTVSSSLIGSGTITKRGAGTLTLDGLNTMDWNIEAGTLATDVSTYTANATIGAAGTLRFDQATDAGYAGKLSGSGAFVKTGAGNLEMNADSSAYTGTTRVAGGMLSVVGKLGGNADVQSGRLHVTGTLGGNAAIGANTILSGTGTIGQNVTLTGGELQGTQGRTLTIGGDLTLDNASRVNVALGRAGATALFDVGGNLALAGTLNVTDQGAFGAGVYRLFDYGGTLTTNTMAVGNTPTGITANDLRIQTAVNGQVNLMSTAGATLSFWDGGNATQRDNGVINGGAGTWRTDGLNWTNADGTLNGRFQPNPTFAVFQGASGTVVVDTSAGAVGVTGMQFTSSGYRVQGDAIALSGAGGETIVRVGSGLPTGAGTTATLTSSLTGASKLVKSDFGTLVLAGTNSYTGGTEIRGGTLSIASDANLGASSGGLTLNGGALATTASFDSARAVTLTQTADITVAAGTTLGLQGAIGGTGNLQKLGAGTLTLTGANTYGNTKVLAGMLVGNTASIRGDLTNNGSVVFNQATDATYAGYVSGTGTMAKQGSGVLTLTGVNAQDWRVDAGTLAVSADRYTSNTTIASGAEARFNQTSSTSFSGVLSGAGQVTKTGAGMLQLVADSSAFTGQTQVQSGTLWVSDKLGGSASVTGGRLHTDGVLGGDVTVSGAGILSGLGRVDGNATLTGGVLEGVQGQTLTVGGDLSLSGTSLINVELGHAPNNALFDVGGNLTLAGTLNVTDQGGFGSGIYRLFDYGGSLVDNGLTVGATPSGVDASALKLQTAVGGQVNLASTSGATLSFWDGGNTARHDNGAIDGGSGTWRTDGRNWANVDGTLNGAFQPNPTFAVFQGTAGTVTVDTSAGAIGVTGMQLATDGYRIEGDAIALQGAGGESIIRVGSGSSADAGMTGTIAASLTGASKLAKTDFGRLVLTGDNTYTGGTDVRVGTLAVSKDANLGAATGGLTLSGGVLATTASFDTARSILLTQPSAIDVAATSTFGLTGTLAGNGDLAKAGTGMLTISGDGSAYTGSMLVQAGALNMASTGKLGGTLTLASGTLLQGSGQVGTTTLQSGAILAPGKVNGTLNVAGDLTFMPGSTYQVAADPVSSDSARVAVSGVANLAGSVVHVGPEGGFETTRQYTILSANAINGQFDNVSSNYAYLAPALRYGAQDVTLQLGRKVVPVDPTTPTAPTTPTRPIAFADAARTGNQRAVANALDSLPSGNALHEYILTLPNGAPPAAFNSLSGEAHASVTSSLMSSSSTPRTLPLSHLRANLNAGMRPGAPTAQAGGTLSASALPSSNAQPAWAELVGNWQTQNATDNTAQVRQHTGGVFVGADHAVGNGWRVGGAVGYTDSKIRVDDRSSNADVSGYSAAIYGGKSFDAGAGKLNLLVGTSYTWHDVSTERYATVAGASQKLTADYGASTTQLFTELGYAMPLSDRTTLEPFVGLAWSDLRSRSFKESGGSAALSGQSSSDKQTSSTLGMRAQTDFTLSGAEGRLQATLGWRHAFGDVLPQSTMAFDGGQAFTVSGAPIARNAAVAELGAEVAVSKNASLGLNYSGQYGGGNREHAGSLNVRWRY
ncbi:MULTISPECIES: autotransporter domain-containing protein [Achromobacter]|uniref:Autotransporter domain-containing protein n=1 Tax=Achromobacter spanius TaxID=217203 RepID=A0ABY8GX05_9BURK|nr:MULTISPECIES: autotransporter domain-containing protein [Achromobacter]WAI81703.1 autotransporter domain-containing protein [Achromobacter spanius]WEX97220.1 autotransporter domain-containing protein [Achromobacter sp. SS2-2022]WFP09063.1 autotransporter domain-containing protein [Achromobacter spanius]